MALSANEKLNLDRAFRNLLEFQGRLRLSAFASEFRLSDFLLDGPAILDDALNARFQFPTAALSTYIGDAANTGSNTAHLFKNRTTLGGSTRIVEFHNDNAAATPEAWIRFDGSLVTPQIRDTNETGRLIISTNTTQLVGTVTDSGTNVALLVKNSNTLSGTTRIIEFHNDNAAATPEAYISNTGDYVTASGIFQSSGNTQAIISGNQNDGASAVGVVLRTLINLTNATAKLVSVRNNTSTEMLSISKDGKIAMDATDASGSPGAATINKPSGQVAVANGVSSVVVTNSIVSATSVVTAVLQDNTDAIQVRSVVPGAGTFTINLTGNTTGARKVGFVVFN